MLYQKSYWGPLVWNFLHAVTFNLPEKTSDDPALLKEAIVSLFDSLRVLIPCDDCRGHYTTYVDSHPIDYSSSESIQKWMVDFHNSVSSRLNKKQYDFEEIRNFYVNISKNQSMLFVVTSWIIKNKYLILIVSILFAILLLKFLTHTPKCII
jgi:hypothetical protein